MLSSPVRAAQAEGIRVNPLSVLIPATLCTSFSFLLPASNPPNAVVFAYGHFSVADMVSVTNILWHFSSLFFFFFFYLDLHDGPCFQVKAGLGANVIGLLVVLLAVSTWGVPLFSLDTYPDWAPPLNATVPWRAPLAIPFIYFALLFSYFSPLRFWGNIIITVQWTHHNIAVPIGSLIFLGGFFASILKSYCCFKKKKNTVCTIFCVIHCSCSTSKYLCLNLLLEKCFKTFTLFFPRVINAIKIFK